MKQQQDRIEIRIFCFYKDLDIVDYLAFVSIYIYIYTVLQIVLFDHTLEIIILQWAFYLILTLLYSQIE